MQHYNQVARSLYVMQRRLSIAASFNSRIYARYRHLDKHFEPDHMVTIRLRPACCHEVGQPQAPDEAWRTHLARIDLRSRLAGNRVCLSCCQCLCILNGCGVPVPVLLRRAQFYGRRP